MWAVLSCEPNIDERNIKQWHGGFNSNVGFISLKLCLS